MEDNNEGALERSVATLGIALESAEQLMRRAVQDALSMATAAYWDGRADALEGAMPQPGERLGRSSTPEERAWRAVNLEIDAMACRRRADEIRKYGDSEAAEVLAEELFQASSASGVTSVSSVSGSMGDPLEVAA